jgi:hypothetical protein
MAQRFNPVEIVLNRIAQVLCWVGCDDCPIQCSFVLWNLWHGPGPNARLSGLPCFPHRPDGGDPLLAWVDTRSSIIGDNGAAAEL